MLWSLRNFSFLFLNICPKTTLFIGLSVYSKIIFLIWVYWSTKALLHFSQSFNQRAVRPSAIILRNGSDTTCQQKSSATTWKRVKQPLTFLPSCKKADCSGLRISRTLSGKFWNSELDLMFTKQKKRFSGSGKKFWAWKVPHHFVFRQLQDK